MDFYLENDSLEKDSKELTLDLQHRYKMMGLTTMALMTMALMTMGLMTMVLMTMILKME